MLAISPTLLMSRVSISVWLNAAMLIGTRLIFSSRLWAVTTISSSVDSLELALSAAFTAKLVIRVHSATESTLVTRTHVLFMSRLPVAFFGHFDRTVPPSGTTVAIYTTTATAERKRGSFSPDHRLTPLRGLPPTSPLAPSRREHRSGHWVSDEAAARSLKDSRGQRSRPAA